MKKLENVRDSNLAFNQLLVGEYLTLFFALIGIGSSIVAQEMAYNFDTSDGLVVTCDHDKEKQDYVKAMLAIANISTIPFSNTFYSNFLVASIIMNKVLYVRW